MAIDKRTFKEQVYDYLKEAIVSGEMKPEELYSEKMIGEKLQVSRTPVREAVLQLAAEDLIEIFNNRGFSVKPISLTDIHHVIETRRAIEGYALKQLALNIEAPDAQKALAEMERYEGVDMAGLRDDEFHYEYMKADMAFHFASVKYLNNPYFFRIVKMVEAKREMATMNSLTDKDRQIAAMREHEAILKPLRAGDAVGTLKAFNKHMDITEVILRNHLER